MSVRHFYTIDDNELQTAAKLGYAVEGPACYVYGSQAPGTVPLHRLFNKNHFAHFYTIDDTELQTAEKLGYAVEGPACYVYSSQAPGTVPLHRLQRPLPDTTTWYPVRPREYDGMPITCELDADNMLVRATAVDRNRLKRQLSIARTAGGPPEKPLLPGTSVLINYLEDGAVKYYSGIRLNEGSVTVFMGDEVRDFNYSAAVKREYIAPGQDSPFYIRFSGNLLQRRGPVMESSFDGSYRDGVLEINNRQGLALRDLRPSRHFGEVMSRAAYFAPVLMEPVSPPRPNPLDDPNNQRILQDRVPPGGNLLGTREWFIITYSGITAFAVRVACAGWEFWPWGTSACIFAHLAGAAEIFIFTKLMANQPFAPEPKPPDVPRRPPDPPPPPIEMIPDANEPPPFPLPYDCPGGCLPNQVCIAGRCVDIAGPWPDFERDR